MDAGQMGTIALLLMFELGDSCTTYTVNEQSVITRAAFAGLRVTLYMDHVKHVACELCTESLKDCVPTDVLYDAYA